MGHAQDAVPTSDPVQPIGVDPTDVCRLTGALCRQADPTQGSILSLSANRCAAAAPRAPAASCHSVSPRQPEIIAWWDVIPLLDFLEVH